MRIFVVGLVILGFTSGTFAQNIRGYVTDADTKTALVGANVLLYQEDSLITVASTDTSGLYQITPPSSAIYVLEVRFLGYKPSRRSVVLDNSNQKIDVDLISDALLNAYPMIRAKALQKPNELLISNALFRRLPGSFDDPSRLLIRFPTLSSPNDQANQVVVKGLPPHMAKWTIDGAAIINPNHLSNAGSITDQASASGGGVNMISGRWIDQYRFILAPLPNQLFDGGSGISDTKLATPKGFSYALGLLGTELSYSHDFSNDVSAGLSYRYSTLGILSSLGVDLGDEDISFQDLHFMLNKSEGKNRWKYHFLWGNSKNIHDDLGNESISYKDAQQINFEGQQIIHHAGYQRVTEKINYNTALNFSQRSSSRFSSVSDLFPELQKTSMIDLDEKLITWGQNLSFSIAKNEFSIHSQTQLNQFQYESKPSDWWFTQYGAISTVKKYRDVTVNIGAGFSSFRLNQILPELRSSVQLKINQTSRLQASYSMQGQSIFSQLWDRAPSLRAFTSQNLSLDYFLNTNKSYIQLGIFYHYFDKVPTLDNTQVTYLDRLDLMLQGLDQGYNISQYGSARLFGLQGQYEWLKIDRFQSILAGSIYNLEARSSSEAPFDLESSYDFGYTGSVSGSYTWYIKENPFVVSLAYQMRGAENHLPIDESASQESQSTIYQLEQSKSAISGFSRFDLKCHFSWGKRKQHMLSLDIQNLLNRENLAYPYYDPLLQQINIQNQLGLIPILSFNSSI